MLLDNLTRAVAKMTSDGRGGGGLQVFGSTFLRETHAEMVP
jgi:hypothetical protein